VNIVSENKKNLVVLLPGLNGSRLELGQLPRYIEESGFDVSIPDILGYEHGASASSMESWLQQVHAFLDAKMEQYASMHLVGISMGATLSSVICSQRSDIMSLALLSPILRYDGWSIPWYRPLLDFFYLLGFRNWEYVEREPFGLKNLDLRRRIKERFETSKVTEVGSISISAKHLYEAKRLMSLALSGLPNIDSKLLVIQSIEDDACSVWSAEKILKNVKSDIRRSIWLGNSYHIVTIDNERETVLNEVVRFLDASLGHEEGVESYQARSNIKTLRSRGME
jgi:carboxylesterase